MNYCILFLFSELSWNLTITKNANWTRKSYNDRKDPNNWWITSQRSRWTVLFTRDLMHCTSTIYNNKFIKWKEAIIEFLVPFSERAKINIEKETMKFRKVLNHIIEY